MELFWQTPSQMILFFILYGMTGAVPLVAALYLLLRRGNAFAPDVTPPVRLRRWAASFFAVSVLSHVWWYIFYVNSSSILSVGYVVVVVLDCVTLLTTVAGTLLSMLQDRRRPVWPVPVAMIPFVVLGGMLMLNPSNQLKHITVAYILFLFLLFTVYVIFAARRYARWLNDNYADLENKKVWLSLVVALGCLLLLILYAIVDIRSVLIYIMHFIELLLFGLLLWRVETLPNLTPNPAPVREGSDYPQGQKQTEEQPDHLPAREEQGEGPAVDGAVCGESAGEESASGWSANIDLEQMERLLEEHCVTTQLYLQHDLTLHQLARTIGTNRSYLSQYFSRQGITYNTYINNLRINHFISRYQKLAAAGQPVVAQQLARDSGYRSYSTFSLAFKQRTGQSVTAWMRSTGSET